MSKRSVSIQHGKSSPGKDVPPRCPDFDLAPISEIAREALFPKPTDNDITTQAKRLTLLLALAFNDYKALDWAREQLNKGKPTTFGVNPYDGQWVGMSATLARLSLGILYELAEAVRKNGQARFGRLGRLMMFNPTRAPLALLLAMTPLSGHLGALARAEIGPERRRFPPGRPKPSPQFAN